MTLWQTLFGFGGRIGRGTFWLLIVAVLLLDLAVAVLVSDWVHATYLSAGALHRPGGDLIGTGFGLLIVAVGSAWAFLALKVKRAHDLGHSGWWLLIGLIPVYGAVRLLFELGFRAGSPRRNRHGGIGGSLGESEPATAVGPIASVWTNIEPSETPLVQPEPQLEPPAADLRVDEPPDAHPGVDDESVQAEPDPQAEPPAPIVAETLTETPRAEPAAGAPEGAEPALEPAAEAKPRFVHPIMDWGKTYRADVNWPEFQPPSRPAQEASVLPPEPAVIAEASRETESEPHEEPPLTWTPAPSHEAYAELGAPTPEPANDPQGPRDRT